MPNTHANNLKLARCTDQQAQAADTLVSARGDAP